MIVEDVGAWDEIGALDYEHEAGSTAVAGLADAVLDASAMYAPGGNYGAASAVEPGDIGSWWDDLSGIVQGGINAYRDRKRSKRSTPGIVPSGYGSGFSGGPTTGGSSSREWMPWAIGGVAAVLLLRR